MAVDQETIDIAEDQLAGSILKLCVGVQDQIRLPWGSLPEEEQQRQIDVMAEKVRLYVREACNIIASERKTTLRMEVEQVTFKDGVKAVLTAAKSSMGVFDLAIAEGGTVTVLLNDYDKFTQGTGDVKANPDQAQLALATQDSVPEIVERDGRIMIIKDGMPLLGAPNPFPDSQAAQDWLGKKYRAEKKGGEEPTQ